MREESKSFEKLKSHFKQKKKSIFGFRTTIIGLCRVLEKKVIPRRGNAPPFQHSLNSK